MKKFIDSFKKIFDKSFKHYPITSVSVWITTVLFMININLESPIDLLNSFLTLLMFLGFGSYVIESKQTKKIFYIIPSVVAIIYFFVSLFSLQYDFLERIGTFYLISSVLMSIYFNYKNSKKDFSEYLREIYTSLFKISFVYGVVALSILIIGVIFQNLIFDIGGDLISNLEILWLGLYLGTNVVYMFKASDETQSNFVKLVIRNVLTPIAYIAVIIAYLYIIKVFLGGEIPSMDTFYAITYLFVITINAVLTSKSYKEEKLIDKINSFSTLLFLPFIFVQMLSVGNSIYIEGLDSDTYYAIIIIILEIVYVVLSILKKDYGFLFIVANILVFISIVVPVINCNDLTDYVQYKNLEIYVKKDDYSNEEKKRIYHGYDHFRYDEEYNGDNVYTKLGLSEEDKDVIEKFYYNYEYGYDYEDKYEEVEEVEDIKYYKYNALYSESIDITGYSKMYTASFSDYDLSLERLSSIEFKFGNDSYWYNLRDYYLNSLNYEMGVENYFKYNHEITSFDGSKLVITRINMSVADENIRRFSVDGYILVR